LLLRTTGTPVTAHVRLDPRATAASLERYAVALVDIAVRVGIPVKVIIAPV
jgi:hypothetical protein